MIRGKNTSSQKFCLGRNSLGALLLISAVSVLGCSGSNSSAEPSGTGGLAPAGGTPGSGGSVGSGGESHTGGAVGNGGSQSTQAAVTGGSDNGGSTSSTSLTTGGGGGQTTVGGKTSVGGTAAVGGATGVGGKTGAGGTTSTGGKTGAGGTTGVGGKTAVGGTTGVGGTASVGGKTAVGGTTSVGGATGVGGKTAVGGTTGTGGTAGAGGTSATGTQTSGYCPATGSCKISPLGDSITEGMGWNYPTGGGYRSKLFSLGLKDAKNFTFVGTRSNGPDLVDGKPFPKNHEGTSGISIEDLMNNVVGKGALTGSAVQPHIILLHIGTNNMYGTHTQQPEVYMGQLLDKIIQACPDALLVVAKIIPYSGNTSGINSFNSKLPGLVSDRANKGAHIILIDQNTGFLSTDISTDNVHPNEAGYTRMAGVWYTAISQYLH
jgi:hypothetical protein